jgi:hypothetical protein
LETLLIEVHNTTRVIVDPDFPGDKRCKLCTRINNIFVLEKHHILPKGWGGPTTEAESARGTVWDYADANCHNTVHLILDHMKKVSEWDQTYVEHWDFPYGVVRYAKFGWQRYIELLEAKEASSA